MDKVDILDAVKIINNRVKPFAGTKRYLATGNLSGDKIDENIVWVNYDNKPSRADLLVEKGNIIVARMQATNKVLLIDESTEDLIVSTGFLTLAPKDEFDERYLSHYFSSPIFQRDKDKYCSGATQKAINNGSFAKLKVPKYPLNKQKKIAGKLDQANSLRQKRKEQLRLLDDYLKSVFLEMFGDPKDFDSRAIAEIAEDKKGSMRTGPFGSNLKHSEFVDEGIAVLGIDNAVDNIFKWKRLRYITQEKYEMLKQYTVYPGDLLITIMGTLGRSAVVPTDISCAINTKHLACITLNKQLANPYFVSYSIVNDPYVLQQLRGRTRGAIMDGLNLTLIKELKIKLPPICLQDKFVNIYNQVEQTKQKMRASLGEMDNHFNALMQRYFG